MTSRSKRIFNLAIAKKPKSSVSEKITVTVNESDSETVLIPDHDLLKELDNVPGNVTSISNFVIPNEGIDGEVPKWEVLKNVKFVRVLTEDISAFGEDTFTEQVITNGCENNTADTIIETDQLVIMNLDIIEHSIEEDKENSEECTENMDIGDDAEN